LSLIVRPVVGRRAKITALGSYVPPDVLTNKDLEKMVETSDQWILERTGIRERHVLAKGLGVSDMCTEAAKKCLAMRGVAATEVEAILVGTNTPDMIFPATACLVQHKIGATGGCWGFDVLGGCSGFMFALQAGVKMIESGAHKKVLVCGGDANTRMVDYTDRATCVLFGDGAGAVLLEPAEEGEIGFIDFVNEIDGAGGEFLNLKGGGSLNPSSHETVDKKMHYIFQDGKAVFKVAVIGMADVSAEIMKRNNLTGKEVNWLVPHQANLRIIDACAERMELDRAKVMINIDRYGNTTAATIPLCLSEWWLDGKIKKGHNLVLSSFGAGYTWGAVLVKWGIDGPAKK